MPEADRNPFVVLQVPPSAGPDEIEQAFRALARTHHPDRAGAQSTARMRDILWARDELRRDLQGWRIRTEQTRRSSALVVVASRAQSGTQTVDVAVRLTDWIDISPRVILAAGIAGEARQFRARAAGLRAEDIRAFVPTGAPFRVTVDSRTRTDVFYRMEVTTHLPRDSDDAHVFWIVLEAPGYLPTQIIVSLTPPTSAILRQEYPTERRAPPRITSTDAILVFGKHKGRKFRDIAIEDPGYLEWMLREGAGSEIERECARAALDMVGRAPRSTQLPPPSRRRRHTTAQFPRRPEPSPAPQLPPAKQQRRLALPDRSTSGGLLARIRHILTGK